MIYTDSIKHNFEDSYTINIVITGCTQMIATFSILALETWEYLEFLLKNVLSKALQKLYKQIPIAKKNFYYDEK